MGWGRGSPWSVASGLVWPACFLFVFLTLSTLCGYYGGGHGLKGYGGTPNPASAPALARKAEIGAEHAGRAARLQSTRPRWPPEEQKTPKRDERGLHAQYERRPADGLAVRPPRKRTQPPSPPHVGSACAPVPTAEAPCGRPSGRSFVEDTREGAAAVGPSKTPTGDSPSPMHQCCHCTVPLVPCPPSPASPRREASFSHQSVSRQRNPRLEGDGAGRTGPADGPGSRSSPVAI